MRSFKKFKLIAAEVSYWAKSNFGNTSVPYVGGTTCIGFGTCASVMEFRPVELDFIAPLMGMTEEVGELCTAKTYEDTIDAIGDVAIYLCDFIGRVDLCLHRSTLGQIDWQLIAKYYNDFETDEDLKGIEVFLSQAIGKLNHVCLKRFQRIRRYAENPYFLDELHKAIANVVRALDNITWREIQDDGCAVSDCPVDTVLEKVWEGIVKKRDWNASKENGQVSTNN